MTLATKIRTAREAKGLTQPELARLAGISQQLVSQLENGKSLTSKKLPRIAQALGVQVADLDEAFGTPLKQTSSHGFAEDEAAIWVPPGTGETKGSNDLAIAIEVLSPNARGRDTYVMRRSYHSLGIMKGDIAIADPSSMAKAGDTVIANLVDHETATSRMIVRRFFPPYLVDPNSDEPDQVITTDSANVVARLVGIIRSPALLKSDATA